MAERHMMPFAAGGAIVLVYLVVAAGILFFSVFVAWRIVAKTGYPGALGLLWFVPIANIILTLMLAFGEWPIERELRAYRDPRRPPML